MISLITSSVRLGRDEVAGVDLAGTPAIADDVINEVAASATRLAPPVSRVYMTAAGLVSRKLVGASASSAKLVASSAFASALASPAPAVDE